jgi:hypothetical protein
MNSKILLTLSVAALALGACTADKNNSWSVGGTVSADAPTILLEGASAAGDWYVIDSVSAKSGKYKFTQARPTTGAIYRVRTGAQTVYFPIDSTENLTLNLNPDGTYTLTGSDEAELLAAVDRKISAQKNPADSLFHRELLEMLTDHYSSAAAYYVVKKSVNGLPLLNPLASRQDYALLRAVTNTYNAFRPTDSRTATLMREFTEVQAKRQSAAGITPETGVIYAPEISYFEIELMDAAGKQRKLSDAVSANSTVILSFVNTANDATPAINIQLSELYAQHHAQGLEIYQVGFDENQHAWSNAVRNLPWITVFQSEGASQAHLGQYMVNQLPTTFIISNGEIRERVDDVTKLKETISKYI